MFVLTISFRDDTCQICKRLFDQTLKETECTPTTKTLLQEADFTHDSCVLYK